jgi:hypothetical protein
VVVRVLAEPLNVKSEADRGLIDWRLMVSSESSWFTLQRRDDKHHSCLHAEIGSSLRSGEPSPTGYINHR